MLNIESTNLGRPSCSKVAINPAIPSETEPQAWERGGVWYYNHPGAMIEAKTLGKRLPDIDEWLEIFQQVDPELYKTNVRQDGNLIRDKLGLKYLGFYANSPLNNDIRIIAKGISGTYWSSTAGTHLTRKFRFAYNILLAKDKIVCCALFASPGNEPSIGMPVRCIAKS